MEGGGRECDGREGEEKTKRGERGGKGKGGGEEEYAVRRLGVRWLWQLSWCVWCVCLGVSFSLDQCECGRDGGTGGH